MLAADTLTARGHRDDLGAGRRFTAGPFALADDASYRRWRSVKLERRAHLAEELVVDVRNPRALSPAERAALQQRIADHNMALYRSPRRDEDPAIPRALGAQLGLERLDANWLADEDGISRIEVGAPGAARPRADFIPYTSQAIGWHTDGYYHPPSRRIQAMILHCVRPARHGGENALLDHELAYIALRDASPAAVQALMQPDAMSIPERIDETGVARPAQSGPVFSVDATGALHMRYTARTRSIAWKDDLATQEAVALLARVLAAGSAWVLNVRLEAGMGLVGHNVLHSRTAFEDDSAAPRLLYRARYLDRVALCDEASRPWRNG
jgi:alpha-ketoglutarate-dependent taurine dioxygenase